MSIQTWKYKYYSELDPVNPPKGRAAIEHSLKKWRGLRPEVLQEHELCQDSADHRYIFEEFESDPDGMWIDCSSCALCLEFHSDCERCPIEGACEEPDAEFVLWMDSGDPEPMIQRLEEALKRYDER